MLNIVTKLLEGGLERPFSQNLAVRPGLKFWELVSNMKTKRSTSKKKIDQTVFQLYYQNRRKLIAISGKPVWQI